jgi:hypothetical protein
LLSSNISSVAKWSYRRWASGSHRLGAVRSGGEERNRAGTSSGDYDKPKAFAVLRLSPNAIFAASIAGKYYRQVSRLRVLEDACSANSDLAIGVRQTLN